MTWDTLIVNHLSEYPGMIQLTINRPNVLNALNKQVILELNQAIDEISADSESAVVIIRGAGERAFVAGADIKELEGMSVEDAYALARRGQSLYNKIETMDKIVIAAINGYAFGGGCELAMACDIRIATANSKFGLPEISLGTVPGYGGTQRLPRLVGAGRAKEMIFTAKPIDAARAYEIGLINMVVPGVDELLPSCIKLAQTMLKNSMSAAITAKRCINEGLQMELHKGIEHEAALFSTTYASYDTTEGISAFLEKRPPKFKSKEGKQS